MMFVVKLSSKLTLTCRPCKVGCGGGHVIDSSRHWGLDLSACLHFDASRLPKKISKKQFFALEVSWSLWVSRKGKPGGGHIYQNSNMISAKRRASWLIHWLYSIQPCCFACWDLFSDLPHSPRKRPGLMSALSLFRGFVVKRRKF